MDEPPDDLNHLAGEHVPDLRFGQCLPSRRRPYAFIVPDATLITAASENGLNAAVLDWLRWQVVKASDPHV